MIITDISILRKRNENVSLEEAKGIIEKLELELINSLVFGVGLAAPQIGINKKVAIIRSSVEVQEYIDLVNPKIINKNYLFVNKDEGCLSFPNESFNVYRYKEVFVIDDLHPAGFVANGFIASIIIHEIEHLESVLIIDRSITNKIGRNDYCFCGAEKDGKRIKYKHCHCR